MSRPSRSATSLSNRERLLQERARAAPLREIYPRLAEVRVELEFDDGTPRSPSAQSYSYFPAARGFFRYACPCHSCNGEFDASDLVAQAADKPDEAGTHGARVLCNGQRVHDVSTLHACPIDAHIRVSVRPRTAE